MHTGGRMLRSPAGTARLSAWLTTPCDQQAITTLLAALDNQELRDTIEDAVVTATAEERQGHASQASAWHTVAGIGLALLDSRDQTA